MIGKANNELDCSKSNAPWNCNLGKWVSDLLPCLYHPSTPQGSLCTDDQPDNAEPTEPTPTEPNPDDPPQDPPSQIRIQYKENLYTSILLQRYCLGLGVHLSPIFHQKLLLKKYLK